MNVEIGTEAPIFLFWEYLFRYFGILSLQCRQAAQREERPRETERVPEVGYIDCKTLEEEGGGQIRRQQKRTDFFQY